MTPDGRETAFDGVAPSEPADVPAEPMADAPAEPMADALAQGEFSIPPLERTREADRAPDSASWPEPTYEAADPELEAGAADPEPGDETSGYAPVDAVTDAFRRD